MGQQKNPNEKQDPQQKKPEDPKTFGNEPPMEEPQTPEHPDQYEVTGNDAHNEEKSQFAKGADVEAKPTLH